MTKSKFLETDFRIGEWLIHPQLNKIVRVGRSVSVEPKVMEVLACLAEEAGHVIPKEAILQRVWADTFVTDDVLIRAISELRRVFEDDRKNPSFIRTVPKRGYQLVGPVEISDGNVDPGDGNGKGNGDSAFLDGRSLLRPAYVKSAQAVSQSNLLTRPEPGTVGLGDRREKASTFRRLRLFRIGAWAMLLLAGLYLAYSRYQAAVLTPRVTRMTQLTDTGRPKGGLVTDGSRIFFSEYREGHCGLSYVSVDGGEVFPMDCPFPGVGILDISPDGKTLLIAERSSAGMEQPLWLMPTTGGIPQRLGDLKVYHTSGAAWSPGGDMIAFGAMAEPGQEPEAAVYIAGKDGRNRRKLVSTSSPVYQIRWSPDGKLLRFSLGNNQWGEVDADGGDFRLVLPGWQNSPLSNRESQGTWTGDGKYFFFTSVREGLNHLWALRKETPLSLWKTPAPMRVTPGPLDVYEPLGDRRPERIFCKATKPRAELSRYVKETGTLEPYLSGISAEMIDFSKDGKWVVYIALPEASLIRSRIDGSERLQLTSPPLQATAPSWSPDGKEIGFMARVPGEGMQDHRIYLVSSSGDNLRTVQTGLGPSWSPDGRYLLFEHSSPSNPEAFHILDLKTNLVTDIPGSSDKSVPRWSPDGRYIAATADYWSKVAVFEFETQNWRTLTTYRGATLEKPGTGKGGGDGAFYPTWSHDGQWVFFIDWTPGFAGIYRVSLSGGEPELVLDMMNPRTTPRTNYPGTLGGWFGLAPDDSILVAVQATEDEIYAIEWEDG